MMRVPHIEPGPWPAATDHRSHQNRAPVVRRGRTIGFASGVTGSHPRKAPASGNRLRRRSGPMLTKWTNFNLSSRLLLLHQPSSKKNRRDQYWNSAIAIGPTADDPATTRTASSPIRHAASVITQSRIRTLPGGRVCSHRLTSHLPLSWVHEISPIQQLYPISCSRFSGEPNSTSIQAT